MHSYIHTFIHTYIHKYIHTYIHTYIQINIHTHTYIYIHAHTYTYTYKKCDGCGVKFSKSHAIGCKKGALVLGRHDDLKNEVAYLAKPATNNRSVRDEPIINIGRDSFQSIPAADHINTLNATPPAPDLPPNPPSNDQGDILIHSFFSKQVDCVIDVRVTDSDAPSKVMLDPMKVLLSQEKAKKRKYLARCEEQRRHFAPYVADCYGLLGKEAVAINKRTASKLSAKWRTAFSVTCGFVNARINITILRVSNRCLRGSRIPFRYGSTMMAQLDDGAGLGLMRY